jgi:hypothetical protein
MRKLFVGIIFILHTTLVQQASDVKFFYVSKSQGWNQTGPAIVNRSGGDLYVFNARVIPNVTGSVGSGSVKLPDSRELALTYKNWNDAGGVYYVWSANDNIGLNVFNADFPNGVYTLRMTTANEGTKTCNLRLDGDAYPNIPQLINFTQAQAIDSTQPFTLYWFPFEGGRTLDIVSVGIDAESVGFATAFESGVPGEKNALNGLSTSVTIPANTLIPGAEYWAHVSFGKVSDFNTTSYPGAIGYAGYLNNTYFHIRTIGVAEPPTISTQPQSQTTVAGSSVTFSVTATGKGPITYQWYSSAWPCSSNTPTLILTNVQKTNEGNYYVDVANAAGTVTSQIATLTVNPSLTAPTIMIQPVNQTVAEGATIVFSVTANGTAPLAYQWRKNGVNIQGATSAVFTIQTVQIAEAGSYSVVIDNSAGSITSVAALLNVNPVPPSITGQPQNQAVIVGANVTFSAAAEGTPTLNSRWMKGGVAFGSILEGSASSLTITNVQASDAGEYSVFFTSPYGMVTSQVATLAVEQDVFPASILINGSFERPGGIPPNGAFITLPAGSTFIEGWIVGGSGVDYFNSSHPAFPKGASDGTWQVDLVRGPGEGGSIAQNVKNLLTGKLYSLRFDVFQGNIVSDAAITAIFGTQSRTILNPYAQSWFSYEFKFVATDETATVSFSAPPTGAVDAGVFVDNVTVNEVGPLLGIRISPFSFFLDTVTTESYQIQYCSDLMTKQWIKFGDLFKGTGAQMIFTIDVAETNQRFYRAIVVP